MPRTLLIVDDDELSREILTLLATEAGFEVESAASGEAALELVAAPAAPHFSVLLLDQQLPGISGDSLARLLRTALPAAKLIAISGSPIPPSASHDAFLLKPFTIEDLETVLGAPSFPALLERVGCSPIPATSAAPHPEPLNPTTYAALAASLAPTQLAALYDMCLTDATHRLTLLRRALSPPDPAAFHAAAHAIKGSCAMVGATELAALAATLETLAIDDPASPNQIIAEFEAASLRLQRMLERKAI